jgi:hypothetical protein
VVYARDMRAAILATLVVVSPAMAHADGGENKAAAAAAFDAGKKAMADGQTAEACQQFQKSQDLDPQYGTEYNLAICDEALGKLASAYGLYDELSGKDANAKRKADSKDRAKKLKPRLTQLTLVVHDPSPQLTVKRDDQDVTLMVGVTTPVDPGKYTFTASAPGRKTWSAPVDLSAEGATITVDIPALEADDNVVTELPKDLHHDERPAIEHHATKTSHTRKWVGIGAAATGVVATAVGVVFGLQARSSTDDAKKACGGALDPCTGDVQAAQGHIDDARKKANLADIFCGAGLAVAAAGVIVWLTAPSGSSDTADEHAMLVPTIGPDGAGLALDGHF